MQKWLSRPFRVPGVDNLHQEHQIPAAFRAGKAPEDPALDQAALAFADRQQVKHQWLVPLILVVGLAEAAVVVVHVLSGDPFAGVAGGAGVAVMITCLFVLATTRRRRERVRAATHARA